MWDGQLDRLTVIAVGRDCACLRIEPAMVLKCQNKNKNVDISEKHSKINSLIHESNNKFIMKIINNVDIYCIKYDNIKTKKIL